MNSTHRSPRGHGPRLRTSVLQEGDSGGLGAVMGRRGRVDEGEGQSAQTATPGERAGMAFPKGVEGGICECLGFIHLNPTIPALKMSHL